MYFYSTIHLLLSIIMFLLFLLPLLRCYLCSSYFRYDLSTTPTISAIIYVANVPLWIHVPILLIPKPLPRRLTLPAINAVDYFCYWYIKHPTRFLLCFLPSSSQKCCTIQPTSFRGTGLHLKQWKIAQPSSDSFLFEVFLSCKVHTRRTVHTRMMSVEPWAATKKALN